jgi:hypothetical protein
MVPAALGPVRPFVETAFFLLMTVVGCAYGHHFLPAVAHPLFLHGAAPSYRGGDNGLLEVLLPNPVIAFFRTKL